MIDASVFSSNLDAAWIQTFSGRKFHLIECTPDDVAFIDIAVPLSRMARFNGHTRTFYSVAQHSVLVSQHCGEFALEGLLHDAAEAYLGDIVRPLKKLLGPHLVKWEERIHECICRRFGLGTHIPSAVHLADERMLFTERRDLMEIPPQSWGNIREPYEEKIVPAGIREAFLQFVARWVELGGDLDDELSRTIHLAT
jgi:uncharacterized protein